MVKAKKNMGQLLPRVKSAKLVSGYNGESSGQYRIAKVHIDSHQFLEIIQYTYASSRHNLNILNRFGCLQRI